ncbi:MAG: PQQ-binding-like beta-propeller repeat protein [Planctomycetota bacterium]
MSCLRLTLIALALLIARPLTGAEIETMDGRTMRDVTLLEQTDAHVRFALWQGGRKMTLTLPVRVIHRIRDEDGGAWRVLTERVQSEPEPEPEPEPEAQPEPEQPPPPQPCQPRGWRGDSSGAFAATMQPPVDWPHQAPVRWKTPLPDWSSGSPTVVGDVVFCTAEPHTLLCIDRADGSIRWQHAHPPPEILGPGTEDPGRRGPKDLRGWTMATPVSQGTHVWVTFGQGMMVCYDLAGERIWSTAIDTGSRWGPGLSSSPLLWRDLVLQQCARGLVAIDAQTGSERWSAAGSSHLLGTGAFMQLGGKDHVISPDGHLVRLEDGSTLARRAAEKPWKSWGPSAVVEGDIAVLHFHGDDKNLTSTRAYRHAPDGTREQLWDYCAEPEARYSSRMGNSPLIHDGVYYAVNDGGHLTALDIETGELLYEHVWGKHAYASLAKAGPYIYATGRETMHVFTAGRSFAPVADFPHGFARHEGGRSTIIPSPFFADGMLYFRDRTHLWCIGTPSPPPAADTDD